MHALFRLTILCYVLIVSPKLSSQVEMESGSISDRLTAVVGNIPGSNSQLYSEPNIEEMESWDLALYALLDENTVIAANEFNQLSYDLIEFLDIESGDNYYIIENAGSNYWGTYILNPNYCRSVVLQSPHSRFDSNTGLQGAHVFIESGAAMLFISGTHRCDHDTFTNCSGTTSVCGTSEAYRISDMAHNVQSIFQLTTEIIYTALEEAVFISLHGFAKTDSDPYVIMSNGSRVSPADDPIVRLRDKLYLEDSSLSFKIGHLDLGWSRLLGFTNTQGRLINKSVDPCQENALNSEGRFIHLEQEKSKLRANVNGWDKLANAVINSFNCVLSNVEKVDRNFLIYPNPFSNQIFITSDQAISQVKLFNLRGMDLSDHLIIESKTSNKVLVDINNIEQGIYILQNGAVGKLLIKN